MNLAARFQRLARPNVLVFGTRIPAYLLCSVAGLLCGTVLASVVAVQHAQPAWPIPVVAVVAAVLVYSSALVTKMATGQESLCLYRNAALATSGIALLLHRWSLPVSTYLDFVAVGMVIAVAMGRVGCLLAGCCHGRPCAWGVCYGPVHVKEGLEPAFVGVPLLPVQALEAVWLTMVVLPGVLLAGRAGPSGAGFAACLTLYAAGRFALEPLRGDTDRPYLAGLSEAQWASLVLSALGAVLARSAQAPGVAWQLGVAVALFTAAAWVVARHVTRPGSRWLQARHVHELAHGISLLESSRAAPSTAGTRHDVKMLTTSLGLRVSRGALGSGVGEVLHYTLSANPHGIAEPEARALCELITLLSRKSAPVRLVRLSSGGVAHLVQAARG